MDEFASMAGCVFAADSPVALRLQALARAVSPLEIAELWVFPPLSAMENSAEFFLFTRLLEGEQRGLYSARLHAENGSGERQVVVEHGSVPADRVPKLVKSLQRRLGGAFEPFHAVINGSEVRWDDMFRANGDGPQNGTHDSVRFLV